MRGNTGALGVFGGVIRLRSSQDRQFGSSEVGSSVEHLTTTDARREHRSGRPAGTKPTRAAARASMFEPFYKWRACGDASLVG